MPFKVSFNNKIFIEPGAYTVVDLSKFQNIPITALFPVILIGTAEKGEPFTAYTFNNALDIKTVFDENSVFYKVADIVFSPSNETIRPSPSQVVCIKINESTKGIDYLSGNTTNIYTVSTRDYSRAVIKVELSTATDNATLTVIDAQNNLEEHYTSGARLYVSGTNVSLETTSSGIYISGSAGSEFYSYETYTTISELVNAINNKRDDLTIYDLKYSPLYPTSGLDYGCSGSYAYSLIYDLYKSVKENSSRIEITNIDSQDYNNFINVSDTIFLEGSIGTNIDLGASTFLDKLFPLLKTLPAGIIVLCFGKSTDKNTVNLGYNLTGSNYQTFLTNLKTFLDNANSIEGETPFVAEIPIWGANYDEIKEIVGGLNTPYMDVFIQKIKYAGEWKDIFYQAVQVGGLKAGLPLGTSLTARKMNVQDIQIPSEYNIDITNKSDREKLILDGIMFYALNKRTNNFEIKKGITSYTASDNDGYTDSALVLLTLYLQNDFSNYMSTFIGHDISASPVPTRLQPVVNVNSLKLAAISKFEQWKSQGYIVDTETKKAYENINVSIEGKVARITANIVLITGVEWIFTTLFAMPYK